MSSERGGLAIIAGPSGVGKSSIIKRLLEDERFVLSVSATTRSPRPGEVDGEDYHFLAEDEFQRRIEANAFLEWALVHGSHRYGTLRDDVEARRDAGRTVLLDIDVQGSKQLRGQDLARIFIAPPSFDELERRLRGRATEDEELIKQRLETAQAELERADEFDHVVVNEELETAVAALINLLRPSTSETEDAS